MHISIQTLHIHSAITLHDDVCENVDVMEYYPFVIEPFFAVTEVSFLTVRNPFSAHQTHSYFQLTMATRYQKSQSWQQSTFCDNSAVKIWLPW